MLRWASSMLSRNGIRGANAVSCRKKEINCAITEPALMTRHCSSLWIQVPEYCFEPFFLLSAKFSLCRLQLTVDGTGKFTRRKIWFKMKIYLLRFFFESLHNFLISLFTFNMNMWIKKCFSQQNGNLTLRLSTRSS